MHEAQELLCLFKVLKCNLTLFDKNPCNDRQKDTHTPYQRSEWLCRSCPRLAKTWLAWSCWQTACVCLPPPYSEYTPVTQRVTLLSLLRHLAALLVCLQNCSLLIMSISELLPDLSLDFLVRHDGSWFAHHHPPSHILPLQASDQSAQIVSCLCPVQRLVEHLNTWAQRDGHQGQILAHTV